MSEELETLEVLKQLKDFVLEFVKNGLDRRLIHGSFDIIEKELKQAQEDKKVLDIFKSSLTIEHCPISIEPLKDGEDFVGSLVRNITTIRTNELDKNLRETLREWVLKNAFPKELKRLEELEKAFDALSKDDEKAKKELSKEIEKNRALEIIRDKKVDVPYIIENSEEKNVIWYNARFMGVLCEGWRMLSQEEFDLLKEELCHKD